jgi:acyl-CoA synthetase (NDP forming)
MLNLLKDPSTLPGQNLAVICPGGGNVVNLSDSFSELPGINLPRMSDDCQAKLQELMPEENVDLKNPIDPGAIGMQNMPKILEVVGNEPYIDSVVMVITVDFFTMMPNDNVRDIAIQMMGRTISDSAQKIGKPVYIDFIQNRDNEMITRYRGKMLNTLDKEGVRYMAGSFKDAALMFSKLALYYEYLKKLGEK